MSMNALKDLDIPNKKKSDIGRTMKKGLLNTTGRSFFGQKIPKILFYDWHDFILSCMSAPMSD